MLPKRFRRQGAIRISYVQQRCDENEGYCDRDDPTEETMSRITAALINGIAETSNAPVYLLHFQGNKKNPVFGLLSGSVRRISALEEDFDSMSIAISRKLIETFALPIHHSN